MVKDTTEYSQIDYIHLFKLMFLFQSMQVLEGNKKRRERLIEFFF